MSGNVQGNSNLQAIEAITQFVGGTQAVWNSITIPVPAGMVVYATDTTVVKMGDGVTIYANLPTLFTISQITSLQNMYTNLTNSVATLTTEYGTLNTSVTNIQNSLSSIQTAVAAVVTNTVYSQSGNVTVQSDQRFIGIANTISATTNVVLPTTPITNEQHIIKDVLGVAQNYNIIVQGGGNNIDGVASYTINTNFESLHIFWNGQSWSII